MDGEKGERGYEGGEEGDYTVIDTATLTSPE